MIYFNGIKKGIKKSVNSEISLADQLNNIAGCNISGRIEHIINLVKENKNKEAEKELNTLLTFTK